MQIVIDIPEEDYQVTLTKIMLVFYGCKITVLPKGHGRLIDADAVLSKIESEYERAEVAMWLYSVAAIVEADKDKEVDK